MIVQDLEKFFTDVHIQDLEEYSQILSSLFCRFVEFVQTPTGFSSFTLVPRIAPEGFRLGFEMLATEFDGRGLLWCPSFKSGLVIQKFFQFCRDLVPTFRKILRDPHVFLRPYQDRKGITNVYLLKKYMTGVFEKSARSEPDQLCMGQLIGLRPEIFLADFVPAIRQDIEAQIFERDLQWFQILEEELFRVLN